MGKLWNKPKVVIEVKEGIKGKKCTKCYEWKPLDSGFHGDKRGLGGRTAKCKDCVAVYKRNYYKENSEKEKKRTKEWYEINKEVALERQRVYRELNREKVAETNRIYRLKNIDKIREVSRRYRERNKDKVTLQKRKWYLANKDIVEVRNLRRRSRMTLARNDLTVEEKDMIWKYFNNKCALSCSDDVSIDHVIPINTGRGGTHKGNIIPLKTELNQSKGPDNIFEWFEANRQRFELSQNKFDRLIDFLAEANDMSVDEYRDYVYWCHENPRELSESEADE